jgi:hemoglobin
MRPDGPPCLVGADGPALDRARPPHALDCFSVSFQEGILDRVGGLAGCRRLASAFYARVGQDPRLRGLFPRDLTAPSERLALFLAELLGGPRLYSFARGRPRMRKRHERFAIGPADRDAWLENMRAALAAVVADTVAREALGVLFDDASASLVNDAIGGRRLRRPRTDQSNPIAGRHG